MSNIDRRNQSQMQSQLTKKDAAVADVPEEPKAPVKKNDIREIRTLRQLGRVNLDLDSPRMKKAMGIAGVSEEDLEKK